MKRLNKILVPTDLSEKSLRALHYGCGLAAEDQAAMVILHVANDLNAWELYSEDLAFIELNSKPWPIDRVLAEASLDLTRFLERQLQQLKRVPMVTRRVVLGIGGETNRRCGGRGRHGFDHHGAAPASRAQTFFERWHYRPGHPVKPMSRAVDYGAAAVKSVARQVTASTIRGGTSKSS